MKAILISGTPATGKTWLAKILSKKLHVPIIHLNELIKKNKSLQTSRERDGTRVVNEKKVIDVCENMLKKIITTVIIEGHLAHLLPKRAAACCIITTCDIPLLKKRLQKRKYSQKKIRQNLDSEILQVCLTEAQELRHHCITVDTTQLKKVPNSLIKAIKASMKK